MMKIYLENEDGDKRALIKPGVNIMNKELKKLNQSRKEAIMTPLEKYMNVSTFNSLVNTMVNVMKTGYPISEIQLAVKFSYERYQVFISDEVHCSKKEVKK